MSLRPALAASRAAPLWLLLGLVAVAYAATANTYQLRLLAVAGCYALAALGYQFIFGRAGALSLAQGAFFGLGAYASGLLALKLGWDFALSFPAAIALAAIVAAIVGGTVLRLASHYFALATLAVAELLRILATEWVSLTGGGNGLPNVPALAAFGWHVPAGAATTGFVWAWVAVGAYIAAQYATSLYGDGTRLLRAEPLAAAAAGLDGATRRLAAFVLSAAFGAAGGALYVHTLGVVSPDSLQFDVMVLVLCMTVIGGRGAVPGAILGALLLVHLPEWLRAFESWALFAYGAALLFVIVLAPDGIGGAVDSAWRQWFGPPPIPKSAAIGRDTPSRSRTGAGTGAGAGIATGPGGPDDRAVLATQGVGIAFGGNLVLGGVTLFLRQGEILGLIGPNGSGKTTLLNLLSGFYPPDTGAIFLDGRNVTREPAWRRARRGLARSFQHEALAADLTALDNVAIAARGAGAARLSDLLRRPGDRRRRQARRLAAAALGAVGAAASAGKPADTLTTSERRRVELARALAADPTVMLLDEPAAGLSEAEKQGLRTVLRDLAARGIGILIVDHGMPFLLSLAHRVVCLDAGRVIAAGTPAEVAADPEVRRAYLGTGAAA